MRNFRAADKFVTWRWASNSAGNQDHMSNTQSSYVILYRIKVRSNVFSLVFDEEKWEIGRKQGTILQEQFKAKGYVMEMYRV